MAANAEAGAVTHGYSHMPDMPVDRKPSRQYKDVSWAVAFVAHLVGVVALGAAYAGEMFADAQSGAMGSNMGNSSSSSEPGQEIDPDVLAAMGLALKLSLPFLGIGLAVGLGWAIVWMALVQRFAEQLIYVALFAAPVIFGIMTLGLLLVNPVAALLTGLMCGVFSFYAYWILSQPWRIEFAKLTLVTVSSVVRTYPGTYLTAFLSTIPATIWQLCWMVSLCGTGWHFYKTGERVSVVDEQGYAHDSIVISPLGKFFIFYLSLSNYWTAQVIKNVVHVTNAGVMATWYFMSHAMPGAPTLGALRRSVSTIFGFMCFGSHLEGLVAMLVMCCISCIIGYIEALLELFNHWAFVQVAIYGKDFTTAAKDTMQLVKSRGLTGLVNMNLTSQAVGLGVFIGAVLSGLVVGLLAYFPIVGAQAHNQSIAEEAQPVYVGAFVIIIVVSVICAVLFTGMVSSTITSCVTTLFVCWAEDPASLETSNPSLHAKFQEITSRFLVDNPYDGPSAPIEQQQAYGGPQQPSRAYATPVPGSNNA